MVYSFEAGAERRDEHKRHVSIGDVNGQPFLVGHSQESSSYL